MIGFYLLHVIQPLYKALIQPLYRALRWKLKSPRPAATPAPPSDWGAR
jgi:hypothetical protein